VFAFGGSDNCPCAALHVVLVYHRNFFGYQEFNGDIAEEIFPLIREVIVLLVYNMTALSKK
jgi:hypothetical protein